MKAGEARLRAKVDGFKCIFACHRPFFSIKMITFAPNKKHQYNDGFTERLE